MSKFHPLVAAKKDGKGPQPGVVALCQAVEELWPAKTCMGIYNYRNVRGGSSLSHHAEGRADDIGVGTSRKLGDEICQALLDHAWELGLDHVIWYERKWSAAHPNGAPYVPSVKNTTTLHKDHIHVGMTWDAAKNMTKQKILEILKGDVGMAFTAEEEKELRNFLTALKEVGSNGFFVKFLIPDIRKGIVTVDELDAALKNVKAGTTVDQFARDLAKQANDKLAKIKGAL